MRGSIEQSWHARREHRAQNWNVRSSARSFDAAKRAVPLALFSQNCNAWPIPKNHGAISVSLTQSARATESGDLDFYEVLGIDRDATSAEVKTAFRKLAKELHPDSNFGNKAAHRRFLAVLCAYTVLRSRELRANYDLYLQAGDTGDDIESGDTTAGVQSQPSRERCWRQAARAAAATIAFTVVFTTGTFLERDTSMEHSDLAAGLTAANATLHPAISVEQLADALYGSDAVLYGTAARVHRDVVTPAVEPDSLPSLPASLGAANLREDDEPEGRQRGSTEVVSSRAETGIGPRQYHPLVDTRPSRAKERQVVLRKKSIAFFRQPSRTTPR